MDNVRRYGWHRGLWPHADQFEQIPLQVTLSAEEFLEDGGGSRWDGFFGEELCTDLQGCIGRFHTDDLGENPKVVLAARAFIAKI